MNDFTNRYKLYWGDLHNHNAVGYAKGSLARSIGIAREHLHFFAFTGHASWHDMPLMPKNRHMHWVNGFKVHSEHWPKTRQIYLWLFYRLRLLLPALSAWIHSFTLPG